ncbi:MAG: tetratricopeptide repeat protein [Deltaproteobacteria bacterium]|nr:tetratricopeptide repeat protein [Deltaproteobacteria bacterium]
MKKRRFWLGLITLFISGVAIGAAGTAIYFEHRIKHALEGDPSILTNRMFKKLSRELQLTEDQRARLGKTVSQAQCDLLRVRARSQPEIDRIINQYINQIKPELTPEQQHKIDMFYKKANGCLFKPINEDKAKELILEVLSKTIDPNRENMYVALEAASQFRKDGLREEAIAEYEKAVNCQDNVPARLALGKLYMEDEEFKKSMDSYIAAIKIDHQCSDAFNGMGQVFKEMKDYPNAMKILNESLRIAEQIKKDPDLIGNANFNIGDVQLEMNEIKAALESFERASQAAPGNQDLQVAIGDALMDKALDEEAVMFFKKAITLDPYKLHVYNRVGIALRKMKRYKEAIQEYKKGIELVPNEENLYYNVSRAYFEMGNLKLAENYIKQALDINQKFDDGAQLLKLIQKTAQSSSNPPATAA